MNIDLDLSSISENVLKKYLNGKGEGIISMFINTTIADRDYSDGSLLKPTFLKTLPQYIKKESYSYVYMPPPANLKFWGKLSKITDAFSFAVLPNNVALRGLTSVAMNFIWGSMNDMSFLTILSLISISVPGVA